MEEQWKDIPGYEGLYQAGNQGHIKSLPKKNRLNKSIILKGNIKLGKRYLAVHLPKNKKNKSFMIHRLIAMTWLPIDNPKELVVNHLNGDRLDNRVCNLEWCTQDSNLAEHWFAEQGRYKRALVLLLQARTNDSRTLDEFTDYIIDKYQ